MTPFAFSRRTLLALLVPFCLPLVLAACAGDGKVAINEPTTARPAVRPEPLQTSSDGSIFGMDSYQPLFEDRRARHVGDTLTVVINENISASRNSDSSTERSSSQAFSVPQIQGLPGKTFQGAGLSATSDNKFDGKGATNSANVFNGTMTVTVTEVLGNGNMVVAGEKQIGINHDSQTVRLSGVVNPTNIVAGNTISSTQIADARIDYRGKGYIDEAQTMGWLARFFLSVLPF